MKVELLKYPTEEDWKEVKRRAVVTMGKTKVITEPDLYWKRKMLLCRHSPIRYLQFSFFITDLPYWVHVELVRHHIGIEKYVKSQRNDRQTEYDRNSARQDTPVNMIVDINAESLMTLANKRLCHKASKEMQELIKLMCNLVEEKCNEFYGFLVPMCVYHGGVCHEFISCKDEK